MLRVMGGLAWLLLLVGVVAGLAAWRRSDFRYFALWQDRRDRLEQEGRWEELRAYLESDRHTLRPFVRLWRLRKPALWDGGYALALHKLGDDAQALAINGRALERTQDKKLRMMLLGTQALILDSLCRYDDVRKLVGELSSLGGSGAAAMGIVAATEFHSGRIDEAIAMTRTVAASDPPTDQARTLLARALRMKGAFAEALAVVDPAASDGAKIYRDVDLTRAPKEVAARAKRFQARKGTTWKALRLLTIAQIHVDARDPARALEALELCAPLIGINQRVEVGYRHALARVWAMRGDAAKVDEHLARLRQIADAHPTLAKGVNDTFSAGMCALELRQLDKALSCLSAAMGRAKHPIERHSINFQIAQTHARAGNEAEAAQRYQAVVADGFATAFHSRAVAALASMA